MKYTRILLPAWILCFNTIITTYAFAEGKVGNSGHFVLCASPAPQKALLDFYSGRRDLNLVATPGQVRELNYNKSQKNFEKIADVLPIVEFWLKGLERLDPVRAQKYREYLRAFPDEWRLLDNQALYFIPDYGDVRLGDKCRLTQAAIQETPRTSLHGRYMFDEILWDMFKDLPVERAGLVLHEIVYREAISLGHRTSADVRILTALIADQQYLGSLTVEKYHFHLGECNFEINHE